MTYNNHMNNESLNCDGQPFYQYQHNEKLSLFSKLKNDHNIW